MQGLFERYLYHWDVPANRGHAWCDALDSVSTELRASSLFRVHWSSMISASWLQIPIQCYRELLQAQKLAWWHLRLSSTVIYCMVHNCFITPLQPITTCFCYCWSSLQPQALVTCTVLSLHFSQVTLLFPKKKSTSILIHRSHWKTAKRLLTNTLIFSVQNNPQLTT